MTEYVKNKICLPGSGGAPDTQHSPGVSDICGGTGEVQSDYLPRSVKGRGFSLMLIIPCHNLLLFFDRRL